MHDVSLQTPKHKYITCKSWLIMKLHSKNISSLNGCLAVMGSLVTRGLLTPCSLTAMTRNSYSMPSSRLRATASVSLMLPGTLDHFSVPINQICKLPKVLEHKWFIIHIHQGILISSFRVYATASECLFILGIFYMICCIFSAHSASTNSVYFSLSLTWLPVLHSLTWKKMSKQCTKWLVRS